MLYFSKDFFPISVGRNYLQLKMQAFDNKLPIYYENVISLIKSPSGGKKLIELEKYP